MNKIYLIHIQAQKHIYTLFSGVDKQLGYARDPCGLFDTLTSLFPLLVPSLSRHFARP